VDLFSEHPVLNLLPYDGTVLYHGQIMPLSEATMYFETLLQTLAWKHDEAMIYGKHLITKRKVAWYGDEGYAYTYSNTTKQALPWTKELLALKALTEKITETQFNSCLVNLYHNGSEGMAYHSDDEKALEKDGTIASLSFGAERKFLFKHKRSKVSTSLLLEHGSLLVMKDETQNNWLHRLPTSTKITKARINLTFRKMV
jgi:alkylated DNA repair dioxygenase AlkB